MSTLGNRLRNRFLHPVPVRRTRSPLRNLDRLEDRIAPAISIVNLALSGGPISEDTATMRTLSGALAAPALSNVDLAIAWGDGSTAQHITVQAGQRNFQVDHTFMFPDDSSSAFTVSVSASYSGSQVFTSPNAAGYVAETVPFVNMDLVRGQPGVVDLGNRNSSFVPLNLNGDSFTFYG